MCATRSLRESEVCGRLTCSTSVHQRSVCEDVFTTGFELDLSSAEHSSVHPIHFVGVVHSCKWCVCLLCSCYNSHRSRMQFYSLLLSLVPTLSVAKGHKHLLATYTKCFWVAFLRTDFLLFLYRALLRIKTHSHVRRANYIIALLLWEMDNENWDSGRAGQQMTC